MTETKIAPEQTQKVVGIRNPGYRAPQSAHVGAVQLAVSNLARSVEFYTTVIGLKVAYTAERKARLTAQDNSRVLIELIEQAGLKPLDGPRLGLFHVAILLPTRNDLSAFVKHAAAIGVGFRAGDHIYSEAIYLHDPDGLGVEVYADRPRRTWPIAERKIKSGSGEPERVYEYAADTLSLRFNDLPPAGQWRGAPPETQIGHVHLNVGELPAAAKFYHQGLGLDIVTWSFPGALFVSAGGYHHRVGLNTWSSGAQATAAGDPRLLFWTLVLPADSDIAQAMESLHNAEFSVVEDADLPGISISGAAFRDPWGTLVSLVTEDAAR